MTIVKVAPSILAGDHGALKNEAIKAEQGGADMIHVDIIDGHFAPNITFGPAAVKAIRSVVSIPLDVHLMITDPEIHLQKFIDAGSDILAVHAEVLNRNSFARIAEQILANHRKVSIALRPKTNVPDWFDSNDFAKISILLVMSVEPGFSGQKFRPGSLEKIRRLDTLARTWNSSIDVEVDGGVDASNAAQIIAAGATILVAGNYVYGSKDIKLAIEHLRLSAVPLDKKTHV